MYTLTKKDSTEYTGLEYWISDKILNDDILWFPMETTDNNTFLQSFDQIKSRMMQLESIIEERTDAISDQLT